MATHTVTVERTIAAPPEDIFAFVADASRHQEIDGSGTVRDVKGVSEPLRLGSKFGMSMHMGIGYSTVNEVIEFEQDRRIAWQTSGVGGLVGGRIWRYELAPVDGGTLVRETWDLTRDKQRFLLARSSMVDGSGKAMTKTLARIASLVERR
ncbi:MAG: SRPBCC family protein [Aeromicrobium sp.]